MCNPCENLFLLANNDWYEGPKPPSDDSCKNAVSIVSISVGVRFGCSSVIFSLNSAMVTSSASASASPPPTRVPALLVVAVAPPSGARSCVFACLTHAGRLGSLLMFSLLYLLKSGGRGV
jgi:hypothetical protein